MNKLSYAAAYRLIEVLPVAQNFPAWRTDWDHANFSEYLGEVCGEPVEVEAQCYRVFYMSDQDIAEAPDPDVFVDRDGAVLPGGWFWWPIENGQAVDNLQGPFKTEDLAEQDAKDGL